MTGWERWSINEKKKDILQFKWFCRSGKSENKNKRKRNGRQITGSCQIAEKDVEYEVNGDINCNLYAWNDPLMLEELEIRGPQYY